MPSSTQVLRRGLAAKRSKQRAVPKSRVTTRSKKALPRFDTTVEVVAREPAPVAYSRHKGVDAFVKRIAGATPMEIVDAETKGVDGMFVKDLTKRMAIPAVRMYSILGVPKATAEKKVAGREVIAGVGGRAALGLARLLAIAEEIVANSKAAEARDFDTAKWLGQWIERPQPALGGRKPADIIGTPTGLAMVERVLGAIESGAYQ
jgi:putative toxin-antitoxin system antitoxin component (TIGR02293 family)